MNNRIYQIFLSVLIMVVMIAVGLSAKDAKITDETISDYISTEEVGEVSFEQESEELAEIESEESTVFQKPKTTNLSMKNTSTTKPETTVIEETYHEIETTKESFQQNHSKDDLYYLAAAVCREAGGESDETKLLVANVIINRVNSSLFPNTIYGVLTQYMQYGMMWKYGVSFPDWADQDTIDNCYEIASRILEGERVCPSNVLFQAEFAQGSGTYKYLDGMYFCYY